MATLINHVINLRPNKKCLPRCILWYWKMLATLKNIASWQLNWIKCLIIPCLLLPLIAHLINPLILLRRGALALVVINAPTRVCLECLRLFTNIRYAYTSGNYCTFGLASGKNKLSLKYLTVRSNPRLLHLFNFLLRYLNGGIV